MAIVDPRSPADPDAYESARTIVAALAPTCSSGKNNEFEPSVAELTAYRAALSLLANQVVREIKHC